MMKAVHSLFQVKDTGLHVNIISFSRCLSRLSYVALAVLSHIQMKKMASSVIAGKEKDTWHFVVRLVASMGGFIIHVSI